MKQASWPVGIKKSQIPTHRQWRVHQRFAGLQVCRFAGCRYAGRAAKHNPNNRKPRSRTPANPQTHYLPAGGATCLSVTGIIACGHQQCQTPLQALPLSKSAGPPTDGMLARGSAQAPGGHRPHCGLKPRSRRSFLGRVCSRFDDGRPPLRSKGTHCQSRDESFPAPPNW